MGRLLFAGDGMNKIVPQVGSLVSRLVVAQVAWGGGGGGGGERGRPGCEVVYRVEGEGGGYVATHLP